MVYAYYLNGVTIQQSKNIFLVENTPSLDQLLMISRSTINDLPDDSQNYSGWMQNRIRTFTQSCGVDLSSALIDSLKPSSKACHNIYLWVTSKWEVRRLIFVYVKASSQDSGLMASLCSTLMVLLHGNDLGNFTLTDRYIVIENPILLCWAELAKYSFHLIATVDKYQSLGDDAPYCKLLYRNALKIYATIARRIAIQEGQDTFKSYAGTEDSSSLQPLVYRALTLIKIAGGANTTVTQSVRSNYLAESSENKAILHDLRYRAHVRKVGETSSDSSSEAENLGG